MANKLGTAVVFSASDAYAPGVIINVDQIESYHHDFADKYLIYADNWNLANIEKLKSICPEKIEIIDASLDVVLKKSVKYSEYVNSPKLKNFINRYGFYHILFPEYFMQLENYKQIIFMETDLLVLNDISYLKTITKGIAWRALVKTKYNSVELERPNGGLLVFNDDIPYKECATKYLEHIPVTKINEVALSRVCYDLHINTTNISLAYNYGPALKCFNTCWGVTDEIRIYHCAGPLKIWRSHVLRTLFPKFNQLLDKYNIPKTNLDEDFLNSFSSGAIYKNSFRYIHALDLLRLRLPFIESTDDISCIKLASKSLFNESLEFLHESSICKFRYKLTDIGVFRIYADFKTDEQSVLKIKNIVDSFNQPKYNYFKYNPNYFTFYCDGSKNLTEEFKEMVIFFDKVVKKFQESIKPIVEKVENVKSELSNKYNLLSIGKSLSFLPLLEFEYLNQKFAVEISSTEEPSKYSLKVLYRASYAGLSKLSTPKIATLETLISSIKELVTDAQHVIEYLNTSKIPANSPYIANSTKLLSDIQLDQYEIDGDEVTPCFKDMAKTVACCFSFSEDFTPYASVTLKSIIVHASPNYNYDLVIFSNGVTDNSKKLLLKLIPDNATNIRIRFFDFEKVLSKYEKGTFYTTSRVSIATYFRMFIPVILSKYEKVLVLDTDIVVNEDIANCYNQDLGEYNIGSSLDFPNNSEDTHKYLERIGVKNPKQYMNVGVLLYSISNLNKENFTTNLINKLKEVKTPRILDQDIINTLYSHKYKILSFKWNFLVYGIHNSRYVITQDRIEDVRNTYTCASIVHYAAGSKPWKIPDMPYGFFLWDYAKLSPFYPRILQTYLSSFNKGK